MRKTLAFYVCKVFLARMLVVGLGINMLVVLLDFMADSKDVMADTATPIVTALSYMALRFPEIASSLMPFAFLIAVLLTLMELIRRQEVVAIMSVGISQLGMVLALTPAVILVGALHLVIDGELAPRAIAELKTWSAGQHAPRDDEQNPIWFRYAGEIVRAEALEDENTLRDVTIFAKGDEGSISTITRAQRLTFDQGEWTLIAGRRAGVTQREPERFDRDIWDSNLKPDLLGALTAHPSQLGLGDLSFFNVNANYGSFPHHVYVLWLNRKLAAPLVLMVMLLLSVPLIQRYQRQTNMAAILAAGIGIGFVFVVTDDVMITLAEAGVVAPALAAWSATLVYAVLGAALAFARETY